MVTQKYAIAVMTGEVCPYTSGADIELDISAYNDVKRDGKVIQS